MNIRELKAEMIRKDKSVDQLCAAMGISRSAWFRRIAGQSQFKQDELNVLRNELGLDDTQTIMIFFADKVS